MDEFSQIKGYAGKLRYADTHLAKIASGSGRTVYRIDGEKVLKIAKNKKGVAQNNVEAEPFLQQYDLTARVFTTGPANSDDCLYLEMELVKKIGRNRFKELAGVSIEELADYLEYYDQRRKPKSAFERKFSPEFLAKMGENEFVQSLVSLDADYDFAVGDQKRLSTWGEVLRDGSPKVVLVDFGLTTSVYDQFYRVELK